MIKKENKKFRKMIIVADLVSLISAFLEAVQEFFFIQDQPVTVVERVAYVGSLDQNSTKRRV